jgi:ABC-type branched-subunit amino acid transport system substrate-binding protein
MSPDGGRVMRGAAAVVLALAGCRPAAPAAPSASEPGEQHAASASEPGRDAAAPAPEARSAARLGAAEQATIAARVDHMSAADLAAAWPRMDAGGEPAQSVALRLALLARHAGDLAGARRWLARAGGGARAAAVASALDLDGRPARPARVAVLLPLTGRHARIGREMRLAIEIAAAGDGEEAAEQEGEPGEGEAAGEGEGGEAAARRGPRVELRFYDTRGEEGEAARQADRAATDGAVGILGPVGQAEARAAAARSTAHGLAIGLLAPDDAGAAPDVGVFRLWPSASWEAAEAGRLAVALGHQSLAVLHPRDAQGAAQAESFRRAAEAAGARVARTGDYDPGGAQLEADIKRFLGLDPATNERLRRHLERHGRKSGWKSFSPDLDFDLVYVPDDHRIAALVASYLPYFNVEVRSADVMDSESLRRKHGGRAPSVVQLLGSSGWYHASLPSRGGAAVDGAVIVVPCAPASDAQTSELAERFTARTGRAPSPLAAQAHDAALLFFAARAAAAGARDPRSALTRALRTASVPDGACGPSSMGPDGQLDRSAALLQVDGSDFTPLEP